MKTLARLKSGQTVKTVASINLGSGVLARGTRLRVAGVFPEIETVAFDPVDADSFGFALVEGDPEVAALARVGDTYSWGAAGVVALALFAGVLLPQPLWSPLPRATHAVAEIQACHLRVASPNRLTRNIETPVTFHHQNL